MKRSLILSVLLVSFLLGNPAGSSSLQTAIDASNKGDYTTAIKWYRFFAEQGNSTAQNNLGTMYAEGKGVAQDYTTAIKWYRLSAEQGDANGQNNLGGMYVHGTGVDQDYASAIKWYRLSAEQGNSAAQNSLGIMYAQGKGIA